MGTGLAVGSGLVTGLAPWGSRGTRALAGPPGAPLRLVLWPMMNGADPAFFWPSTGLASEVLAPLAPYERKTTLVRGIGIAGADNHQAVRATFSGQPISSYDAADPAVPSLDQVVAAHLERDSPSALASLHLGVRPADAYEFYQMYGRSTLFFSSSGPIDYEASPVAAYDRLFASTATPTPPSTTADPEREALSILTAELDALDARAAGLPTEQAKLAQHREALAALATRGGAMPPPTFSCGGAIASVEALRAELAGNPRAAYRDDLFSAIFDAQVDLAAQALVCGLTRVATIQAGSADGNVVVPVGGGLPHHNTSHGDQATFAQVQRWYSTKLARLLAALDVPDPLEPASGRTVLDNSCVLVLAECLPSSHASNEVPCFFVGGAGGRLRAGTHITASGATNRHVLAAIASAFGVASAERAHFGADALTEVLS